MSLCWLQRKLEEQLSRTFNFYIERLSASHQDLQGQEFPKHRKGFTCWAAKRMTKVHLIFKVQKQRSEHV